MFIFDAQFVFRSQSSYSFKLLPFQTIFVILKRASVGRFFKITKIGSQQQQAFTAIWAKIRQFVT
jgi:hypothetical protein